ncbi:MAG: hypothetical protein F6K54_15105 [Okeania sp. SIO3B5]|uniref:hypothetical protein n=1 Tax=Okeania sp. SIO3B5 TaxID=2607811 RepID=UPI0013FFF004|nr:hypothetical protein [Okeania sp. SIO3B5]NEO54297.1 hypothetical protein [Okeania sp. SIO3B5]
MITENPKGENAMKLKKTLVSTVLFAAFLILMLGVGEANADGIYRVDDNCNVVFQTWKSTGSSTVTLEPIPEDQAGVKGQYSYGSASDDGFVLGKRLPYTVKACNPYPYGGGDIKCKPQCEVGFSVQWNSDGFRYPGAIMSYTGSIMDTKKTNTCNGDSVATMKLAIATVTQDNQGVRNVAISKTTFYPADCQ